MRNSVVKTITRNAVVAAIYFLLTFASSPISFGQIQFRLAEALILLCFFRRDFTIGLTLGCLCANCLSTLGPWDILIGTMATLISCLGISFCKHLFIASLIPVIVNGIAIGLELYFVLQINLWLGVGFVALGELICVSVLGYLLFLLLRRNKPFMEAIGANKNLDFKW